MKLISTTDVEALSGHAAASDEDATGLVDGGVTPATFIALVLDPGLINLLLQVSRRLNVERVDMDKWACSTEVTSQEIGGFEGPPSSRSRMLSG